MRPFLVLRGTVKDRDRFKTVYRNPIVLVVYIAYIVLALLAYSKVSVCVHGEQKQNHDFDIDFCTHTMKEDCLDGVADIRDMVGLSWDAKASLGLVRCSYYGSRNLQVNQK